MWRAPLAVGAVFFAAGLAYFAVAPGDASVSSDDGAYVLAARTVSEGGWNLPHVVADADPEGAVYPFINADITAEGFFPYTRRPVWVWMLAGADAIAGVWGMRLLVLAGAAIAVVASGRLGRLIGDRRAAVTSAALAALSPIGFNGLQLWGHAVAVGGLSLMYLGVASVLLRHRQQWLFPMGVLGASAAVAVRSDALAFAGAAALVVVATGARRRRVTAVVAGGSLGLASLVTHLLSARHSAAVIGRATDAGGRNSSGAIAGDRVHGLIDTFVTNPGIDRGPSLIVLVALVLVGLAVFAARRCSPAAAALLVTAMGGWVLRTAIDLDALVTGLLAAWPVVLLLAVRPWSRWNAVERELLAAVSVAAVAVALSQYQEGGGLNWGGRFLSGALPVLTVLTAAALTDLQERWDGGRNVLVAGLVLAAVTTAASVGADWWIRHRHDEVVSAAVRGQRSPVMLTSSAALPRLAWRTTDRIDWLLVAPDDAGGIEKTIAILRAAEVLEVTAFRLDPDDYEVFTGRAAVEQSDDGELVRVAP